MNSPPKYWVVKDSREKTGYNFTPYLLCQGMKYGQLETGDYTIDGLQDKLCIERKASTIELATNLGKDSDRFYRELKRMKDFESKFLILEFGFEEMMQFPKNVNIPQIRITGRYLHKRIVEIQLDFGIQVIFTGSAYNGFLYTCRILKSVNEKYKDFERCEIF